MFTGKYYDILIHFNGFLNIISIQLGFEPRPTSIIDLPEVLVRLKDKSVFSFCVFDSCQMNVTKMNATEAGFGRIKKPKLKTSRIPKGKKMELINKWL